MAHNWNFLIVWVLLLLFGGFCIPKLFQAFFNLSWLSALRSFPATFLLVAKYGLSMLFLVLHYYSYVSVLSWFFISVKIRYGSRERLTNLHKPLTSHKPLFYQYSQASKLEAMLAIRHHSKPVLSHTSGSLGRIGETNSKTKCLA